MGAGESGGERKVADDDTGTTNNIMNNQTLVHNVLS